MPAGRTRVPGIVGLAVVAVAACGGGGSRVADSGPADSGALTVPRRWRLGASSGMPRANREALLLPSDRIFVSASGVFPGQIYDPAADAWTRIRGVGGAAYETAALTDGRVILAGGDGQPELLVPYDFCCACSVLFDPESTDAWWTEILHTPRSHHRDVVLPDGDVVVVGGSGCEDISGGAGTEFRWFALASAERLHPDTGLWEELPPMSTARWMPSVTLLASGEVLVAGGIDDAGTRVTTAELYDPAARAWRTVAPMRAGRAWHAAARLGSGRVLVAGGDVSETAATDTVEIFDPSTETWSPAPPLPGPVADLAITELPFGGVLVTGGRNPTPGFGHGTPSGAAVVFDETSGAWIDAGTLNVPRYGHSAVLLPDGRVVIVAGGRESHRYAEPAEISEGAFP